MLQINASKVFKLFLTSLLFYRELLPSHVFAADLALELDDRSNAQGLRQRKVASSQPSTLALDVGPDSLSTLERPRRHKSFREERREIVFDFIIDHYKAIIMTSFVVYAAYKLYNYFFSPIRPTINPFLHLPSDHPVHQMAQSREMRALSVDETGGDDAVQLFNALLLSFQDVLSSLVGAYVASNHVAQLFPGTESFSRVLLKPANAAIMQELGNGDIDVCTQNVSLSGLTNKMRPPSQDLINLCAFRVNQTDVTLIGCAQPQDNTTVSAVVAQKKLGCLETVGWQTDQINVLAMFFSNGKLLMSGGSLKAPKPKTLTEKLPPSPSQSASEPNSASNSLRRSLSPSSESSASIPRSLSESISIRGTGSVPKTETVSELRKKSKTVSKGECVPPKFVYWSTGWAGSNTLYAARINETTGAATGAPRILLSNQEYSPAGIYVDSMNDKLYWGDAYLLSAEFPGQRTLCVADVDTANPTSLVNIKRLLGVGGSQWVPDVFVDGFHNRMYWVIDGLYTGIMNSSAVTNITSIRLPDQRSPRSLSIDNVNGKVFITNDGNEMYVGNIDLENPTQVTNKNQILPVNSASGVYVNPGCRKIYWLGVEHSVQNEPFSILMGDFNVEAPALLTNIQTFMSGNGFPVYFTLG